ncbi:MAG: hypothetical protein ACKODX_06855 [Gemmata sp.]
MTRAAIAALALGAALSAPGCSDSPTATVTGAVSYDGKPVKSGHVTFTPTDGKGPTAGALITDGKYTATNVPPGPKTVKVEANSGEAPSVQTSADGERVARELKGKYGADGVIRTDSVPPDAEGNNREHEVKAGPQTLDLNLKPPAKR